jgi:hypothetical protein
MNHWEVLEIVATQDIKEIKRAYAKRLKTLDLGKDAAAFQVLRDAYEQALAAAKGVKQDAVSAMVFPSVTLTVKPSEALQREEPNSNFEAERQARELLVAIEDGLAELVKRLMVDYGERAWSVHTRRRSEIGGRSFDGSAQWDHKVFSCLVHWSGSPFPGAFAEQFAQHAEIFQDIKYQQSYPYAFFLYFEKLASYRSLREMIRQDPKDAAWAYILAAPKEASHEKAARNMVIWAAVRRLLVSLEDERPELLHTMFHQDTLAFWQKKIRGVPPIWSSRGFLWGIWGIMFLPFIFKTSIGLDLHKENAGVHLIWTFAVGYFHRWLFYALANLLRYRHIGRGDVSLVKVLKRPKMRVACFVAAIAAIAGCYVLPTPWAGILPFLSLFAAWLALGTKYYQMAILNGIIAMIVSVDLIGRLPDHEVFLSTFVPFMYLGLGVLYFVRLGYVPIAARLPSWISNAARGIGLFVISGLVVRFGLQLILSLSGS